MKFRVKVYGPNLSNPFGDGLEIYQIEGDVDEAVTINNGFLQIALPPYPGHPGLARGEDPSRPSVSRPPRKATGPSRVTYPPGQWSKTIVTELLEEEA